jgi:hypothetical protein
MLPSCEAGAYQYVPDFENLPADILKKLKKVFIVLASHSRLTVTFGQSLWTKTMFELRIICRKKAYIARSDCIVKELFPRRVKKSPQSPFFRLAGICGRLHIGYFDREFICDFM